MPEENIKTYIIDASFVVAYLLPDEKIDKVNKLFEEYVQGEINLISSTILPLEVANAMKSAIGQHRIEKQKAVDLINEFLKIGINFEPLDLERILDLSLKNQLSVYDASYLYLAEENNIQLLTLDKKLEKLAN